MKNYFYVTLLFLLGCTNNLLAPDSNTYSDDYGGLNKNKKIFVTPINEVFKDLDGGGKIVFDEIVKQLEASGWKVSTMSEENYLDILSLHAKSVGGFFSPETGMKNIEKYNYVISMVAKNIGESGDYAAVIIPSFSLKTAKLGGRNASWDGVKRKYLAEGRYAIDMRWSGNTKGLSIELSAFTPSGEWIFTSYGGLMLPFHTTVKHGDPVNELRSDMFESENDIKSGIEVALIPIIHPSLTNQARRTP